MALELASEVVKFLYFRESVKKIRNMWDFYRLICSTDSWPGVASLEKGAPFERMLLRFLYVSWCS